MYIYIYIYRTDQQAVELARAAAQPADVIMYWVLERLEDQAATPVTVPCPQLALDVAMLKAAAADSSFAVVSAAVKAVHSHNHAALAKVSKDACVTKPSTATTGRWVYPRRPRVRLLVRRSGRVPTVHIRKIVAHQHAGNLAFICRL
jgi:hypothetical protein